MKKAVTDGEKILKHLLLADWLQRGERMATIREMKSILEDPYAWTEMVLGNRRGDGEKLIELIRNGQLEKGIIAVATAIEEDNGGDYSSATSESATMALIEDLLDGLEFDGTTRDIKVMRLAHRFTAKLRDWLGDDKMMEVAVLNRKEKHPGICHSHDFCDANQAMVDAWSGLFPKIDMDPGDEMHADLINAAWDMAKKSWKTR